MKSPMKEDVLPPMIVIIMKFVFMDFAKDLLTLTVIKTTHARKVSNVSKELATRLVLDTRAAQKDTCVTSTCVYQSTKGLNVLKVSDWKTISALHTLVVQLLVQSDMTLENVILETTCVQKAV